MLSHSDNFEGLALKDVIPKDRKPWWKDWTLLKLNTLLLCALITQIASGYDSSMLNGMQSLPQWQKYFGSPTGTRLGAMTFGPTGGILISVLVSSQLCEKFGRRWPICGGSIIIIFGSILQTAAINYGMFVVSRFFVGFGLGIVATAAPPLLTEVAYPTHRGKLVSFYLVTWSLGSLIAAWITYGTFKMSGSSWSWRIPSVLQCSFSLVQAVLSVFAPESPRWLIYQGRHEEALAILTKYHGDGEATPLVRFEMAEITATLEMEKIQKASRWTEWIATKGNKHRLFIALYIPAMLQWSGNALTSYYLSKVLNTIDITDSKVQLIINACLSVWSFLTAAFFALLVDRAGRRRLFLCGMGGMGLAYIIWTICSALNEKKHFEDKGFAGAVLAMIFVFSAAYHMCSPVAPTYIMEVVPFSLRAKASMMYQLTGNLAGLYNSFANPVAMDAISWRYYIVWCCVIAVNFVIIFLFFPETKGKALEEVAEIFDGPDALAGVNAMRQMGLDVNADKAVAVGESGKAAHVERA
ncbi:general substrate transporter [Aspergillus pseudodeflectus]|jgi:sugar porter (SP) family MFS transporter|uniref:General substrate transporter n=2 Tax=Aspergillus subgen. Nidulantes TaxID=2720870 RepID=A0ABR4JDV9_9EURO|nr:Putative Hexose transporter protein [Aspergillus calidoustus]